MIFGMEYSGRFVINDGGHVEIYDTGNYRIFRMAQDKAQTKR
jgi:hypothetical protein